MPSSENLRKLKRVEHVFIKVWDKTVLIYKKKKSSKKKKENKFLDLGGEVQIHVNVYPPQ